MIFFFMNFMLVFFWFNLFFLVFMPNVLSLVFYYIFNLFFMLMFFLNMFYNKSVYWYSYMMTYYKQLFFNIDFTWGFDILSLNLILLCAFLLLFCYLSYWNLKYSSVYYFFLLNFSLWTLINVFSSLDFFNFFVFFELIVIPMFLLIGIWGSSNSKITASYQLFMYTLFGSIFVFMTIFDMLLNKGNLSFDFFLNSHFMEKRQFIIWVLLFLGFSVKMPVVPLHLWLPEAHVEAPTPGSVILAGILLKLGSYAVLSFLLGSFSLMCYDLMFIVLVMALFSLTHSSMVALCQIDMKKVIAYSSVAHMNYSLIGLFSQSMLGLAGAYCMIFSHAMVSSALFLGIGVLYDSYSTRLIFYYGGLATLMPMFSIMYFVFILSNFGFPGTFNFMGEFLLTYGALTFSFIMTLLTTFSLILSLMYSLFLYNSVFFGTMKMFFMSFFNDLTRLEFMFLLVFLFMVLFFGMFPMFIFENVYMYSFKLSFLIV